MEEDEEIRQIRLKIHNEDMQYPEYVEGFNSEYDLDKNPYEFPYDLHNKIMRIAHLKRPLTKDEKSTLKSLNEEYRVSPYALWSMGCFRKSRYPNYYGPNQD